MDKSFKKLSIPYQVWLYLLAIIPIIVMFILSFLKSEGISTDEMSFSFENFILLSEISTLVAFRNSLLIAFGTTAITIFLGYFVAYKVFKSKFRNKFLVLTILILPMWSNLLLRTEALGNIMEPNNIITNMFNIELADGIRGSYFAVLVGQVFTYLPFMILPIYNALEKIDYSLEEAALDLGLTNFSKFFKVILPLSTKGIITGAIMVFLPTLSGFAIPEILGKGNIIMIGNIIEQSFRNMNYNLGSLLAIIILIFIMGSLLITSKIDKEGEMLL